MGTRKANNTSRLNRISRNISTRYDVACMNGRVPEKHDLPHHQSISTEEEASAYSYPWGGGEAGLAEAPSSARLTPSPPALAYSRGVWTRKLKDEPTTSSWGMASTRLCTRRLPRLVRRRVGTEHMASVSRKLGLHVSTALCPGGAARACRMGRAHCFTTSNPLDGNPFHEHTNLDVSCTARHLVRSVGAEALCPRWPCYWGTSRCGL